MNTIEQAFLSDIRTTPKDDGIRLIYADWLEENGQRQRAELIRLQVELARLAEDDPKHEALADRQDELLALYGEEWERPFFDSGAQEVVWNRGLIEAVVLKTDTSVDRILRSNLIRIIHLRDTNGERLSEIIRLPEFAQVRELIAQSRYPSQLHVGQLATDPGLAGLTALSLGGLDQGRQFVESLATSVHLQNLSRLEVTASDVGDEGVAALSRSPVLGRLSELNLNWNNISASGVRILLGSSLATELMKLSLEGADFSEAGDVLAIVPLRRLQSLCLYSAGLGPDGIAGLASSTNLASLRHLDLSENYIGDEGLMTLYAAPHLSELRELELDVNDIGPEGVASLARSSLWQRLTMVSLLDRRIGEAGAAALTDSPSLLDLRFWGCGIGPEGVESLASRSYPRLERLDLSSTEQIGDEGLSRLLERARFPRLKALNVSFTNVTPVGVRMLAASSLLGQLVSLDLSQNSRLGDGGAEAIASSPYVTHLRKLNLSACSITDQGARALASSRHFTRIQELNLYNNTIQANGTAAANLRRRFGNRVVL